jgi:hypothetical protein
VARYNDKSIIENSVYEIHFLCRQNGINILHMEVCVLCCVVLYIECTLSSRTIKYKKTWLYTLVNHMDKFNCYLTFSFLPYWDVFVKTRCEVKWTSNCTVQRVCFHVASESYNVLTSTNVITPATIVAWNDFWYNKLPIIAGLHEYLQQIR